MHKSLLLHGSAVFLACVLVLGKKRVSYRNREPELFSNTQTPAYDLQFHVNWPCKLNARRETDTHSTAIVCNRLVVVPR